MLSCVSFPYTSLSDVSKVVGVTVLFGILSCATYNAFLHPLACYPGPWLARISPVYNLIHAYRGDLHLDILRCHKKYGKIVRYAPNRLLFSSTEALKGMLTMLGVTITTAKVYSVAVYGHSKTIQKSKAYNPHPYYPEDSNLFACVDKFIFARKKRFISQAMTKDVMASAEPYIITHGQIFCDAVTQVSDAHSNDQGPQWASPRDMAEWTYFYSLDVISDLIFGQSFGLLKKPDYRWLTHALTDGNRYMYLQFAWPEVLKSKLAHWVNLSGWIFPAMLSEGEAFARLSRDLQKLRRSTVTGTKPRGDITSALEEAVDPKMRTKMAEHEIWTEALTLIRAGGDTVSTALAATLFYLSHNSESYERLESEIRTNFSTIDSIRQGRALSRCHYLRACLNEAMRLSPPAPGSFWREITGSGAFIDGVFVPAGYEVGGGIYALHHNQRYFSDPYAFRPERFLLVETSEQRRYTISPDTPSGCMPTSQGSYRETASSNDTEDAHPDADSAFVPFLLGPRTCPARNLAYLEMSLLIARIMWSLDFRVVGHDGQDEAGASWGEERESEFRLWDIFSAVQRGPLLQFKKRED